MNRTHIELIHFRIDLLPSPTKKSRKDERFWVSLTLKKINTLLLILICVMYVLMNINESNYGQYGLVDSKQSSKGLSNSQINLKVKNLRNENLKVLDSMRTQITISSKSKKKKKN